MKTVPTSQMSKNSHFMISGGGAPSFPCMAPSQSASVPKPNPEIQRMGNIIFMTKVCAEDNVFNVMLA